MRKATAWPKKARIRGILLHFSLKSSDNVQQGQAGPLSAFAQKSPNDTEDKHAK